MSLTTTDTDRHKSAAGPQQNKRLLALLNFLRTPDKRNLTLLK